MTDLSRAERADMALSESDHQADLERGHALEQARGRLLNEAIERYKANGHALWKHLFERFDSVDDAAVELMQAVLSTYYLEPVQACQRIREMALRTIEDEADAAARKEIEQ